MITVKEWSIKLDKDGMPYLIILDEKYHIQKVIRLESEEVNFNQQGFSFERIGRRGRTEKYECLYKYLSREQTPSPIDQLLKMGSIKEKKRHSLVFLYELVSGIVLRINPIVKCESLDIDALVGSYAYLNDQFGGVDFKEVATSLHRSLTDKKADRNG